MFLIASCCTISYPFEIILKTAPCVEPGCIDKWHVASQHCMGKTRFHGGQTLWTHSPCFETYRTGGAATGWRPVIRGPGVVVNYTFPIPKIFL